MAEGHLGNIPEKMRYRTVVLSRIEGYTTFPAIREFTVSST
jgi:hypothetical protein